MSTQNLCPGCRGRKYYPTDLWEAGTAASIQPCAICCREEHTAFWSATDDNERICWFADKKLLALAVCEIRPRETLVRLWDKEKGYFAPTLLTLHEVFIAGEPEAVATSPNRSIAEVIARMLATVPLKDVPSVIKAISAPALARTRAIGRREPGPALSAFERHSIAS